MLRFCTQRLLRLRLNKGLLEKNVEGRRALSSGHRLPQQSSQTQGAGSRAERTIKRLPGFLQKYAQPIRHAPVTHVSAFLILHEITALVPLFGLAAAFHYTQWLPPYISEGKWVSDGVEKFGRYFRKKGWLGEEGKRRSTWWGRGEGSIRILVELGTAYAITKALLPLRLMLSLWATPWFARVSVVPVMSRVKRLFGWQKAKVAPTPSMGSEAAAGRAGIAKTTGFAQNPSRLGRKEAGKPDI